MDMPVKKELSVQQMTGILNFDCIFSAFFEDVGDGNWNAQQTQTALHGNHQQFRIVHDASSQPVQSQQHRDHFLYGIVLPNHNSWCCLVILTLENTFLHFFHTMIFILRTPKLFNFASLDGRHSSAIWIRNTTFVFNTKTLANVPNNPVKA